MTTLADELVGLHRGEWLLTDPSELLCVECGHGWPCRTALALQEHADEGAEAGLPVDATLPGKAGLTPESAGEDPLTQAGDVPPTDTPASPSLRFSTPLQPRHRLDPTPQRSSGSEPELQGEREQLVVAALRYIDHHRRLRNVRACSGCDWTPTRPGYASDPEDTLRRHADFNEHLARLIVDAVT